MQRHFNTAGLCFPAKHYMVDPLIRLSNVESLLEDEKFFVIHAPRQTGKTTAMRALMEKLNREETYIALHFSCETASVTGENFEVGNRIIVNRILNVSSHFLPEHERPPELQGIVGDEDLRFALQVVWKIVRDSAGEGTSN